MNTPASGAVISDCGTYRYRLWRVWNDELPVMAFVAMNPSTADHTEDDPTIRRMVGFAKREGCGGIVVFNVFALRSTDPALLLTHDDPFGPENEEHLLHAGRASLMTLLVVAWGSPQGGRRLSQFYQRAATILVPQQPYCLGTTKGGHPKHPLYLKGDTPLVRWYLPGDERNPSRRE